MKAKIPFFRHDLGSPEIDSIRNVFEGRILTTGNTVAEFEARFSAYLGRKHSLAVNSCTGALHLSLLALGIGPGDEVITTPLTFIATATAIMEAGAIPIFIDIESDTGNIDVEKLESAITPHTKAIIPVHLYGLMCDMLSIKVIADKYNLAVIEDCAHCVEGERDGIRPGQISDVACFSFFATKNLTCGEGGALVTDNKDLFERLKLLSLHGMNKTAADRFRDGYQHWDMIMLGWKYNLSNIQAAILLPQLDRLQNKQEAREELANIYLSKLVSINGIEPVATRKNSRHAHHLFPVLIRSKSRDDILSKLIESGIEVVVNYRAIHLLSFFQEKFNFVRGDFPAAEKFGDQVISLPFYPGMPSGDVEKVVDTLSDLMC